MGMLFDHGCDAIANALFLIVLTRVTQTGHTYAIFLAIGCSTVPNYYCLLEEHLLGSLVLPAIIGPDDGSLIIISICFLGGLFGSENFYGQPIDLQGLTGLSFLPKTPNLNLGQIIITVAAA